MTKLRRRLAWAGLVLVAALVAAASPAEAVAARAPARINGSGSTYVALAMQQWVADAQTSGLQINYLPTGSPQGLTGFGDSLIDFAGTEAEYSALGKSATAENRGYQYVPDVAGAVAVMYNVNDAAGRKIDYLHLSRETVARIFIGDISSWSDPAISKDNIGLELPDQPITVVYRGGQSGTTALFYDFVQHMVPDKFSSWAAKNSLPTDVRIIQLDGSPTFAPKSLALNGSDQIAQFVASNTGKWSIAYDEFGYAKTYKATSAWIQNEAGEWVLPYAENISAALESATLRPDLSQELAGVYKSANPLAYPISAYSYLLTQCAPSGDRATCKAPYSNLGVGETLERWMRYIACDGQVNMARIGYSPLPPNLSQEIANSIGRLTGKAPEQLGAGNCSNPRFKGSLGGGAASPKDPLKDVTSLGNGAGGNSGGLSGSGGSKGGTTGGTGGSSGSTGGTGGTGGGATGGTGGGGATGGATGGSTGVAGLGPDGLASAAGLSGDASAASDWRAASPAAYKRGENGSDGAPMGALLLLAVVVVAPFAVPVGLRRRGGELGS